MINEKKLYDTLKVILEKIGDDNILWRLEGSANLFLQNVEVNVNDLDITTNKEGYSKFIMKMINLTCLIKLK